MKRLVISVLVVLLSLALVGCNKPETDSSIPQDPQSTVTSNSVAQQEPSKDKDNVTSKITNPSSERAVSEPIKEEPNSQVTATSSKPSTTTGGQTAQATPKPTPAPTPQPTPPPAATPPPAPPPAPEPAPVCNHIVNTTCPVCGVYTGQVGDMSGLEDQEDLPDLS